MHIKYFTFAYSIIGAADSEIINQNGSAELSLKKCVLIVLLFIRPLNRQVY